MDGQDSQLVQAGPAGSRVTLRGGPVLVGRGAEAQLQMDDDQMSRQHFALTRGADGWSIRDLNSTNGTYVNGQRLAPEQSRLLRPGDRIKAGRCHWTFDHCPPAAPAPHAVAPQVAPPRMAPPQAAFPAAPVVAPVPYAVAQPPVRGKTIAAWQWVVSAVLGLGLIFVTVAVFLPWFRVEVQLMVRQLVEGLPGGDIISGLLDQFGKALGQPDAWSLIPQTAPPLEISGADVNAYVLLISAGLVLVFLVSDLALRLGRSSLPGLAYLAAIIVPAAVKLAELQRVLAAIEPLNNGVTSLFGKDLLQLAQGASSVVKATVTPQAGVYLAGAGFLLLLIGGIARCVAPLVRRA